MKVNELFDLSGRVSVVTGGSMGLGFQMATALAEAGSSVVLCARNYDRCAEAATVVAKHGVETLAVSCDVRFRKDVRNLVRKTLEKFEKIDVLVNSAGIAWADPPERMKMSDWQKVIDVNLTGTFICCQEVGRVMIKSRKGSIINVSSVLSTLGNRIIDCINYTASKGGVDALTRDLAVKWAPFNIRVNAIAPGFFKTHLTKSVIERRGNDIINLTPAARIGEDDDLKGPVVFLASDASKFITGQVIAVDGGYSIM
ncbi:MAG: SDR family oxidoreductase [Methanomassiliicoccales archaeon]|nr:SDR family oxidoreductase [Methanomassiliicoccales archaeon]